MTPASDVHVGVARRPWSQPTPWPAKWTAESSQTTPRSLISRYGVILARIVRSGPSPSSPCRAREPAWGSWSRPAIAREREDGRTGRATGDGRRRARARVARHGGGNAAHWAHSTLKHMVGSRVPDLTRSPAAGARGAAPPCRRTQPLCHASLFRPSRWQRRVDVAHTSTARTQCTLWRITKLVRTPWCLPEACRRAQIIRLRSQRLM